MPAVVGELEPGDELGVAKHGGHALAGVVVEDGQGLVRAGGRRVDPAAVERDLDQRPVLANRTLERPDLKKPFMLIENFQRIHPNFTSCASRCRRCRRGCCGPGRR